MGGGQPMKVEFGRDSPVKQREFADVQNRVPERERV